MVLHRSPTSIRIRPIEPRDADALDRFYAGLSDESRATRFLGATRGLRGEQARRFCSTDHHHREGLVAVAGCPADTIVGHLCLEPDDEAASAEMAIAVADAWQRRGIGRALLEAGIEWARHEGLRQLTAVTWAANVAIARLLDGLGLPVRRQGLGAEIRVVVDLDAAVVPRAA
jgi:RimJ/RimL family protein N-acetyltransferase